MSDVTGKDHSVERHGLLLGRPHNGPADKFATIGIGIGLAVMCQLNGAHACVLVGPGPPDLLITGGIVSGHQNVIVRSMPYTLIGLIVNDKVCCAARNPMPLGLHCNIHVHIMLVATLLEDFPIYLDVLQIVLAANDLLELRPLLIGAQRVMQGHYAHASVQ